MNERQQAEFALALKTEAELLDLLQRAIQQIEILSSLECTPMSILKVKSNIQDAIKMVEGKK